MLKYSKGEKNSNGIIIKQPNLTLVEIQRIAETTYTNAMKPGLDGEVTLWGIPRLEHGMIADLYSNLYPEKNGSYYIDSVKKKSSPTGGYRQVAKLGNKTS